MYREEFKIHLERLGYSPSSQSMLPTCVAEFLSQLQEKGICELTAITPQHIAEHYEYLSCRPNQRRQGGLSSRMITHHLYAIRLFLNYHEQIDTIKANPISGLNFPRPESQPRAILTVAEIKQLYAVCETYRERSILGLFYGCGLRRSEGVELNVRDISFSNSLLYVRDGKNSKRRVIPINEQVKNDFKTYLYTERWAKEGETAFITNAIGSRTSGNSYNEALKTLINRSQNHQLINTLANQHISLHNLRHSIATHLLENGLSVEYVRDFLGHKHLEATQIYTRINNRKLLQL